MDNLIKLGIFVSITVLTIFISNRLFDVIIKRANNIHLNFLKSIVNVIILVVTIYSFLSQFDITKDISSALLKSGTLIIAIATFAAQQTLANAISGITLSVTKPFDVGQKISLVSANGNKIVEGIVSDINMRHTVITQYDGQIDMIPNSVMNSVIIVNTNLTDNIGYPFDVEVSRDSDITLAIELLSSVIDDDSLALNLASNKILAKSFTQNGVVLSTHVWASTLDDSFQVSSNIRLKLMKVYKDNGIIIIA